MSVYVCCDGVSEAVIFSSGDRFDRVVVAMLFEFLMLMFVIMCDR